MKYTLSVLVENQPGVLSKVSGLFSRRGFNIDSLAVGETEDPSISCITIVVDGDEHIVEQVDKQLNKVIQVIKVRNLTEHGNFLSCELALIKVSCNYKERTEIMQIAGAMQAKVVDVATSSLTLQIAADSDHIESLTNLLRPYGIKESVCTGTIAMERGIIKAKR
jgi:acetolactate synthase-1/3 small subunit